MAPLKFAGLALGSLVLSQATATQEITAGVQKETEKVLQWFNLYRNGKVDYQLPDLGNFTVTVDDQQGDFLTVTNKRAFFAATRQSITKDCSVKDGAYNKGLVLEVKPELDGNYGKLLDEALDKALPDLLTNNKGAGTGDVGKATISSMFFLSSETPKHVDCRVTTDCDPKFLFCKFSDKDANTEFIQDVVNVKKEFAEAVQARKNANIKIAELISTDAHTPLTSGASKVAVSALAMLSVAASALLI